MPSLARRPKVALELKFCGPRKGPDFEMVLPIFRGWRVSRLRRKAWHMQLWLRGPIWLCAFGPAVLYGCTECTPLTYGVVRVWLQRWLNHILVPDCNSEVSGCWQLARLECDEVRWSAISFNINLTTITYVLLSLSGHKLPAFRVGKRKMLKNSHSHPQCEKLRNTITASYETAILNRWIAT